MAFYKVPATRLQLAIAPTASTILRLLGCTIDDENKEISGGMSTQLKAGEDGINKEHYVFDAVVGAEELLWIYHELLSTNAWSLNRTSKTAKSFLLPFVSFPGLSIETNGEIHVSFLSGYFRSIIFRIREQARRQHQLELPHNIQRIHVGAKSSFSKTEFHSDSNLENCWSIVGFLNPVWNANDGGEFFLEKQRIEFKAGRFVVFPSKTSHDGGYVRNEKLNYWRVAVNIILDGEEQGS